MITIEPTPQLIEEIQQQMIFQQKMGYTDGVAINTKWLATGQGCPIHGVPPGWQPQNSNQDI